MRITPNTTLRNSVYNIQLNRNTLDNLEEKTSSGKNYNSPSDDPVAARFLVGLNDSMSATSQYNSNITKSDTWYQITNVSLTGMSNFLQQAVKTVASVSGGETDPNVLNNAVMQLKSLKQQIVDMGNTTNNGVYVFGGTNNLTKPFVVNSGDLMSGSSTISNMSSLSGLTTGMPISGAGIPANTTISGIDPLTNSITISNNATSTLTGQAVNIYAGNTDDINVEINQDVTQAVNIPGKSLLMAGTGDPYGSIDILKTLDQLIIEVGNGNSAGIQAGKQGLYDASIQLNASQSDLQSRTVRVESAAQMNQTIMDSLSTVYGNVQNVDYAALGVQMNQQMTALQATLSTTAKISQMSLLDYM